MEADEDEELVPADESGPLVVRVQPQPPAAVTSTVVVPAMTSDYRSMFRNMMRAESRRLRTELIQCMVQHVTYILATGTQRCFHRGQMQGGLGITCRGHHRQGSGLDRRLGKLEVHDQMPAAESRSTHQALRLPGAAETTICLSWPDNHSAEDRISHPCALSLHDGERTGRLSHCTLSDDRLGHQKTEEVQSMGAELNAVAHRAGQGLARYKLRLSSRRPATIKVAGTIL